MKSIKPRSTCEICSLPFKVGIGHVECSKKRQASHASKAHHKPSILTVRRLSYLAGSMIKVDA